MVQDAFQVQGVLHCLLIALKEQVPGKLGLVLGVRLEPVPEVKQEQMEQELGMMQVEFVQAQVQAMRLPGQALELVLVVELAHLFFIFLFNYKRLSLTIKYFHYFISVIYNFTNILNSYCSYNICQRKIRY